MATGDPEDATRCCVRLLAMVGVLHGRGLQRLRIAPGLSPSGTHWRCAITHAGNVSKAHGASLRRDAPVAEVVRYSSGEGAAPFGWRGAEYEGPERLAERFVEAFGPIARRARGADEAYVAWYAEVVRAAEGGALPVAYADWYEPPPADRLPTTGTAFLPMPPGGVGRGQFWRFWRFWRSLGRGRRARPAPAVCSTLRAGRDGGATGGAARGGTWPAGACEGARPAGACQVGRRSARPR